MADRFINRTNSQAQIRQTESDIDISADDAQPPDLDLVGTQFYNVNHGGKHWLYSVEVIARDLFDSLSKVIQCPPCGKPGDARFRFRHWNEQPETYWALTVNKVLELIFIVNWTTRLESLKLYLFICVVSKIFAILLWMLQLSVLISHLFGRLIVGTNKYSVLDLHDWQSDN